jgi:hypothetical protein
MGYPEPCLRESRPMGITGADQDGQARYGIYAHSGPSRREAVDVGDGQRLQGGIARTAGRYENAGRTLGPFDEMGRGLPPQI